MKIELVQLMLELERSQGILLNKLINACYPKNMKKGDIKNKKNMKKVYNQKKEQGKHRRKIRKSA